MYIETVSGFHETKLNIWKSFLKKAALEPDESVSRTVLLWDGDTLVGTGSRTGNLLKCIAVDAERQGEGLTATLVTALRQDAFLEGISHLFLYTKPENKDIFSSLFFYTVAETDKVLLMENRKDGITDFLNTLPAEKAFGPVGAAVMHCNPFTRGHRYLIETAACECAHFYVFVVSEDKSLFSAEDRLKMVQLGTADIPNVTVLTTGPYLISSATFPTYFLKEREKAGQIQCLLDIEIFTKFFVPRFSITRRYVGTEPLSPMTNQYNLALKENLPKAGVSLKEIARLEASQAPISASAIRQFLAKRDIKAVKALVPDTTFDYLQAKGLL